MAKKEKVITLTYKHRNVEILVEIEEKDISTEALLMMFEKVAFSIGLSHKEVQEQLLIRANRICI